MTDDTRGAGFAGSGPWGPIATVGFSLLLVAVYMLLQYAVLMAVVWISGPSAQPGARVSGLAELRNYGDVLTFALLSSALGAGGLLLLIARARRGIRVVDYLALRRVPVATIAFWLGTLFLYVVAWELLAHFLGREQTPGFMKTAYSSTHFLPLLWLGVIVAAPMFEEAFFRGFLFAGIAATRIGASAAILLTALFWAGLHLQYDWYDMTSVFLLGLLFGVARHRTGSLWPSLSMHMMANLVATLETATNLMR